MKVITNIVKVLVALAAVAGAVYAIATYGDKLVAWAKKLLNGCPYKCAEDEFPIEEPIEDPVTEEVSAEEEVPAVEEVPAEEPAVEAPADDAPVADDSDFEG